MSRVISRLSGGLGNQMFQYAFARSVQEKYGGKIIFDLHLFNYDEQFDLSLIHFKLNNDVVIENNRKDRLLIILLKIYTRILQFLISRFISNKDKGTELLISLGIFWQHSDTYYDYFKKSSLPIKIIYGNYMSEKYFTPIKNILKEEFRIKTIPSEINKNIISQLKSENSVCIHIRRGDYANSNWASKLLVCDFEYYQKAIKHLDQVLTSPVYYVFTNNSEDVQWIKKNYKFNVQINYIDLNNPDYEDFRLMTNCKNFVLSNSTYSWWASYLAENTEKIVIAPSRWNTGSWDMKDIYLPSWKVIDV